MRMPQSGYTLCMKKTMRYMALLALWVLVGAGARAEEMVVTADGFRRAAQGPNGTVLLLEQDVRLQDGIAVRVDALAALIDKNSERVWETVLGGDGEDALYQAISLPQGWLDGRGPCPAPPIWTTAGTRAGTAICPPKRTAGPCG